MCRNTYTHMHISMLTGTHTHTHLFDRKSKKGFSEEAVSAGI